MSYLPKRINILILLKVLVRLSGSHVVLGGGRGEKVEALPQIGDSTQKGGKRLMEKVDIFRDIAERTGGDISESSGQSARESPPLSNDSWTS